MTHLLLIYFLETKLNYYIVLTIETNINIGDSTKASRNISTTRITIIILLEIL